MVKDRAIVPKDPKLIDPWWSPAIKPWALTDTFKKHDWAGSKLEQPFADTKEKEEDWGPSITGERFNVFEVTFFIDKVLEEDSLKFRVPKSPDPVNSTSEDSFLSNEAESLEQEVKRKPKEKAIRKMENLRVI